MRYHNLFVLIFINIIAISHQENCSIFRGICRLQSFCGECLNTHHCCNYCFDPNYNDERCDIASSLTGCAQGFLKYNVKSSHLNIKNEEFSNENTIRFRPQELDLVLRLNEPKNITIQYRTVKDYPLYIYYLMDLTYSMRRDLDTMRQLGEQLTKSLETLTKNAKVAFGSFVDKKAMPFYFTDSQHFTNPCYTEDPEAEMHCEEGYLFRHHINFTNNYDEFFEMLHKCRLSANVDNYEGGFEALMQIILCQDELGWLPNSMKLVVLATQGPMHLAGDGKLSGSVKVVKECLFDSNGNFDPLMYDYPSVAEIHRVLDLYDTNMIIATKDDGYIFFKEMEKLVNESVIVEKLEKDSSNILSVVEKGYHNIVRRIRMNININNLPVPLKIRYFMDCNGKGDYVQTDRCDNIKEDTPITFKVEFEVNKNPYRSYRDVLELKERNFLETVQIHLTIPGDYCQCDKNKVSDCGENGKWDCDRCNCNEGYRGEDCSIYCYDSNCRDNSSDSISSICYNNGYCDCGECKCYIPFTGKFCEYECPSTKKIICSGHGQCDKGNCICNEDYEGEDCSCSKSKNDCIVPGAGTICNSHGSCECNKCKCDKGYSGKYCENCRTCDGLCNVAVNEVMKSLTNSQKSVSSDDNEITVRNVDKVLDDGGKTCYIRYKDEGLECEARYTYTVVNEKSLLVDLEPPKCSGISTAKLGRTAGIILAAVITAGILALVAWKSTVTWRDRIEYARFMQNEKNFFQRQEKNPLFKPATTEYRNPIANYELSSMKQKMN